MKLQEIEGILSILDKGGVVAALSTIIYYGKKFVEKIVETHNNHINEIIQEYKKIQEETNQINKEAIKTIAKYNDLTPQICEIYQIIKNKKATNKSI